MNYIILEGNGLKMFFMLLGLIMAISVGCLTVAIIVEKRNTALKNELKLEKKKIRELIKENYKMKMLFGELKIDEK